MSIFFQKHDFYRSGHTIVDHLRRDPFPNIQPPTSECSTQRSRQQLSMGLGINLFFVQIHNSCITRDYLKII